MASYSVVFNGFTLSTSNIIISDVDDESSPDATVNLLPLAKAPRSTVTSALKQQKTVTVKGTIIGSSVTDCTTQIRTYKGFLVGKENVLTVNDGITTKNYVCTVNKNVISRPNNLTWAKFETTLICSQPYAYDTSATTVLNGTSRTLASYSDAITVGGNAEWQTPIITITLTAVTGATNQTITIGNALIGQACAVTRTWANGDVLVIDSSSITAPVTVNGTQVIFTGGLPTFNPSNLVSGQTITYNDTFATRTMTELVQNVNRWD